VRPWVAEELFGTALRNPQQIFRSMEREMDAMERQFDNAFRHSFGGRQRPFNAFPQEALKYWLRETPQERFYGSKEYEELVNRFNKEQAEVKTNYAKQLNTLRAAYEKQAQELYDRQIAEAEKEAPQQQ
jgi:hypothetical protein